MQLPRLLLKPSRKKLSPKRLKLRAPAAKPAAPTRSAFNRQTNTAPTPASSYTAPSLNSRGVSAEAFNTQRVEKILSSSWEELKQLVSQCRVCEITQRRLNPVFGEGNPPCRLVLIGEAPGQQEDLEGKPFVGQSESCLTPFCRLQGLLEARTLQF